MLYPKKWCWRCDDYYYNKNDTESIKECNKCVLCAKEVALKKLIKKENDNKIYYK